MGIISYIQAHRDKGRGGKPENEEENTTLITIDGRSYTPVALDNRRVADVSRILEHSQVAEVESNTAFYKTVKSLHSFL